MTKQKTLQIAKIRLDGGTQARIELRTLVADEYGDAMKSGAKFPPIVVFFDGTDYWLADGFHRTCGAKNAGIKTIDADVRDGTQRDAILYSVGANGTHGLPRNNADKRRAVETLLRDREWSRWSANQIARRCHVSPPFVAKIKEEFGASINGLHEGEKLKALRGGREFVIAAPKPVPVRLDAAAKIAPEVRQSLLETPIADNPGQVKRLAALDEGEQQIVAEKIADGDAATVKAALKEIRAEARTAVPVDLPRADARYELTCCDLEDLALADGSVDAIVTDPPYPREYLPVYAKLAKLAARVLKPGGSCVVMVGHSYLPEILAAMTPHLRYRWTCAYLTPGGQAVQVWDRTVNTFWKPLLWFTNGARESADWIGDVMRSDVNDNDKRFHDWGQSESGMADILERFTRPGELVLDPFCGGGTTGVVALARARRFIGCDVSEVCVQASAARLAAVAKTVDGEVAA